MLIRLAVSMTKPGPIALIHPAIRNQTHKAQPVRCSSPRHRHIGIKNLQAKICYIGTSSFNSHKR
uniref:Uncharacterized protein n=1 Tax=Rhizophora mucronata TaxID=61149 RepID=A0A2P2PBJ3_RHIMU